MDKLIGIARNPIPDGAHPGYFDGYDGARLRYARWHPTGTRRLGTVCVFTGRGEFIEKYFEVITDLRARGFTVAIMDWRGQGGSARLLSNPRKSHIESFRQYERDLHRFMVDVVMPDCAAPYFALGHSMAGLILLKAALLRNCWFDRIVLTSPMLEFVNLPMSPTSLRLLAELGTLLGLGDVYVPRLGGDRAAEDRAFVGNKLTSDRVRFERNQALVREAPELAVGAPTISWLNAALKAMDEVAEDDFAPSLETPVLIVSSGNDEIVSAQAAQDFTAGLRAGHQITIFGARHELLQERDELREQFWAAFDSYIPGSESADLTFTFA